MASSINYRYVTPIAINRSPAEEYQLGLSYEKKSGVDLSNTHEGASGLQSGDMKQAIIHYTHAAQKGNIEACLKLSSAYGMSAGGLQKDCQKAFEWSLKAANQGSVVGQIQLAGYYQQGLVVRQDHQKAIEWYRKAASHPVLTQHTDAVQALLANDHARYAQLVIEKYTFSPAVLTEACQAKNLSWVLSSIKNLALPDSQTLTWACASMNLEIIEAVINIGAQPDGETLTMACSTYNFSIVSRVLALGAQPGSQTLEVALKSGDQRIINAVKRAGAK